MAVSRVHPMTSTPGTHSRSDHSISIQGTNQTVDLTGGNPGPRTPVILWSRWGGQNQLWKFEQHQDKPDRVFASQCEPRLTKDNQSGMAYPVTFWPK